MNAKALELAVRRRLSRTANQIEHTLRCVDRGNPLAAEPDPSRLAARLRKKANLSREEAEAVARGIESADAPVSIRTLDGLAGPEKVWGTTLDFLNVCFLERGSQAARAVGRVAFLDGRAHGSGWLISDRLFITNHHVIETLEQARSLCLELDYEVDLEGKPKTVARFAFDPMSCFVTDDQDDLDYTVIAIGPNIAGGGDISAFGFCGLSDAGDKHALGEVANIVQHPDGRMKEVVLRENRLVSRLDSTLHYVADTEPGSSGSPVFNNEWQVIAIHHWGGPWRQRADDRGQPIAREVNEGIRTSAIVRELKEKVSGLSTNGRLLLSRALELGESNSRPVSVRRDNASTFADHCPSVRVEDGRATWTFPVELSMCLPTLIGASSMANARSLASSSAPTTDSVERVTKPSTEYGNRSGYKPRFIQGHTIELPALSLGHQAEAAPNLQAEPGDDPFELKYHHFSIVMNRRRKLAFFTACNIDGAKAKKVDRKTGAVSVLLPNDPGLEAASESAEATEKWYSDERLDEDAQTGQALYDQQDVPGFPDRSSPARIARMFQRGHLVRRMDPTWGNESQARLADADTFHFTNCAPQLGFFNMGTARRLNLPQSGGGKLWRALENHVLRNAVTDGLRVSSFTGPIFDNNDPEFRGIKIPMKYWKIVTWAEAGQLRSLAMIADQRPVIEAVGKLPETESDAEAFAELEKVKDFLTTLQAVERATGLNFGPDVKVADIRAAEGEKLVSTVEDIQVSKSPTRRASPKRSRVQER